MELRDFQNYCELLPGTAAGFPFDEQTLVYKLQGKIFALTNFHDFSYISLKCEPNDAMVLRQAYPSITAGYHLNKRHWITLRLDHNFDTSPGQGSSQKSDQSPGRGSNRGAGSGLADKPHLSPALKRPGRTDLEVPADILQPNAPRSTWPASTFTSAAATLPR